MPLVWPLHDTLIAVLAASVGAALSGLLGRTDDRPGFVWAWLHAGTGASVGGALGAAAAWVIWGGPKADLGEWDFGGLFTTMEWTLAGTLGGAFGPAILMHVRRSSGQRLTRFFPASFPLRSREPTPHPSIAVAYLAAIAGWATYLLGGYVVLLAHQTVLPHILDSTGPLGSLEGFVLSLLLGGTLLALAVPWVVARTRSSARR